MAGRGRPRGMTQLAEAAFHAYAAMGPRRSLAKLERFLSEDAAWDKKSPYLRELEKWSSKYKWQEKVREYDRKMVEERRHIREERIAETNDEQYEVSREMFKKTMDYANGLIESGQMGSQATVTLLKILADLQRLAVAADRQEAVEDKTPQIQIIIEQDNTPSPEIPGMKPRIIEALPAPMTIETESDEEDL